MLQIPIRAVPNQLLSVAVGGQNCQLKLAQKESGLFCSVYVDNILLIGGVVCQNKNRILRDAYFQFVGDLAFYDLQGESDPDYLRLGTRFLLLYLEASDIKG